AVWLDTQARASAAAPVTGRVVVHMALQSRATGETVAIEALPHSGDIVELRGRLERPDGPRNPGGFDYRAYLARQGIYSTLILNEPGRLRIVRRAAWRNPFLALAHTLRRSILGACRAALPPPSNGIL